MREPLKEKERKRERNLQIFYEMLREAVRNPELAPERLSVISLSQAARERVLTPKRLELLRVLQRNQVQSVSALAQLVHRPLASVSRDLRILANYGFLDFERRGQTKVPRVVKDIILLPLG